MVVYEQPLNERIRAFLRLEYLFNRSHFALQGVDMWDSRAVLETIIDLMALMGRADLKTELIKELERQANLLETLRHKPGVDGGRLDGVLDTIRPLLTALRGSDKTPGQDLRNNELLSNVRQRISIPAGACSFDVPAYQFWLEQPAETRSADLRAWLDEFRDVREAVELSLNLVRESARATGETATKGFFQRSLDPNVSCQMVRVVLPPALECFPEISGGKHRFTIRFLTQESPAERPVQMDTDVDFELHCCVI